MDLVRAQVRRGAYYDSVVLMQLQKALLALPGVVDAGVMMGTEANKAVLKASGLDAAEVQDARAEDLVISIRASDSSAESALAQIDALLTRRATSADSATDYRPKSLESAIQQLPQAQWVLVSVPGRYAATVARDALRLGRNVFLYSDHVPIEEEIALKHTARNQGLLVLGPDCGTAIIGGAGLGFANRVRRGPIGLIGASGTGLQVASVRVHQLGSGVSQVIGTGTRDLSDAVGAITTQQALALLEEDPATRVIVLISKPPSPAVAARVLRVARSCTKPVVIDLIGLSAPTKSEGNLYLAETLNNAADIAVTIASEGNVPAELLSVSASLPRPPAPFAPSQRFLRGLYSGGTLAYEAQFILRDYLDTLYSNSPLYPARPLASPVISQAHTILDLGADEFTVGRLHPMLDNDLRIRRLFQEADDPEVAVILLDVVLGYGAHPNPASELAPAIARVREQARAASRHIEIVAILIGTDEDPQNLVAQSELLERAGARVELDHAAALRYAGEIVQALTHERGGADRRPDARLDVESIEGIDMRRAPKALDQPFAAINVGLESFYDSLRQQDIPVVHIDWHPPAGGNEKLMAILERLKRDM